jgi:mRNA-degrading endonuclease HigB of HigAB toxin-antitoxin module
MRIVGVGRLSKFCSTHPQTRTWVAMWMAELEETTLQTMAEMANRFRTVATFSANIAVFQMGTHAFFVETAISFNTSTVLIRQVGSSTNLEREPRGSDETYA